MATLTTRFLTYHHSGNDLHLRTPDGILFIDKSKEELIAQAIKLRRNQKMTVTGEMEHSNTLSAQVFSVETLSLES